MPIIFSRGCEYALQAMMYLATQPPDTPIFQRDISATLNIPPHFLGKILQSLARNGLVVSQKGKTGGFLLDKPAVDISLLDVIQAIDGPNALNGCVLGFPGCDDAAPCPVHSQWKTIKGHIIAMLAKKNLKQLGAGINQKLEGTL